MTGTQSTTGSAPQQIIIKKDSSGCLPFGCGCLTGIFLSLFIMGGFVFFGIYMASRAVEGFAIHYYKEDIRPEIAKSPDIPSAQKKMILGDLDRLADDFPNMSMTEKAKAIREMASKYENEFKALQQGFPQSE